MSLSLRSLVIGGSGSGGGSSDGYDENSGSSTSNAYTGFVYYGDSARTSSAPQVIKAGNPTTILNDGTLDMTKSYVSKDLANFNFLVANKFMPKTVGDTYLLRLSFKAMSAFSGNLATVRLMAPDVVQQDTESFVSNAGTESSFTFNYHVPCLQAFKTSGGLFEITTDYDASIWGVGLLIIPVSRL